MNYVRFVIAASVFFLVVPVAHAATLYLSPTESQLKRGETGTYALRLDVDQDECVNAIDGVLSYTDNIEIVDISRGQSIMSVWVEEPVIDPATHTITFAGGIPNGYCGRIDGDPRLTNNILDVVVQSPGFVIGKKQGTSTEPATIGVADATQVYLNDGFGTRTTVAGYPATITLLPEVGNLRDSAWSQQVTEDVLPPEAFSIALERTPNAFSNDWFITFNTTDKQTGIDHYEIIEEPITDFWAFNWGRADAPWVEARSPYVLKDQSLNTTIRVRAIDKAGNEYVATLVPDPTQRSLSQGAIMTAIAVGIGLIFIVGAVALIWFLHRWRRRRSVAQAADAKDAAEII